MRIVITGADGFIGRNLRVRLRELGHEVVGIVRASTHSEMAAAVGAADFVFHLAGVNRPKDEREFAQGNAEFTTVLCQLLKQQRQALPVCYASSIQATLDNPYGRSKRMAEELLLQYGKETGTGVYVFRLPNVFGKWCRPHYNSAVATFCHQISRGLPVTVNDPAAPLRLAYVDDVVNAFVALLTTPGASGYQDVQPVYETTVGEVAQAIRSFEESRRSLVIERVGKGLMRALYATYVSQLPPESFTYRVALHSDPRGEFVEMLKTPDAGQFSYFTAHPGVTRGEHYHHTKTEKFLVLRGTARFQFRHILNGDVHEITIAGGEGRIVESVPGWAHNVSNVGQDELVVMLWANEIFDRLRPDTVAMKVNAP